MPSVSTALAGTTADTTSQSRSTTLAQAEERPEDQPSLRACAQVRIALPTPLPFSSPHSRGDQPEERLAESPGFGEQVPSEIEVFGREPEETSGPQVDLFSAWGPAEGSTDSLSLLSISRESSREIFSETEIKNPPTLARPISPSITSISLSANTSPGTANTPGRTIPELRLLLRQGLLERALHEVERGTAVGLVVREARALGVSLPTRQVHALRAPDKSLSLVDQWIAGARALEVHRPAIYASWLAALVAGEPLPQLPGAARLTELSGHVAGTEPGAERERLIDDLLHIRSLRKRERVTLARQRYPADSTARHALRQAHRLVEELRAAPRLLTAVSDLVTLAALDGLAEALSRATERRLTELTSPDQE